MSLTPATNRQVPEKSIMDLYGKQTYLGNSFVAATNLVTIANANIEVPFLALLNPSTNAYPENVSLFLNSKIFAATLGASAIFKMYLNPTIATPGSAITPRNLRSGNTANPTRVSVMTAQKSPIVTGVAQVQTVTTVADIAGSLNNTYFLINSVNPVGVNKGFYMWFNVNTAGTDPLLAGLTAIPVALATGATASAVATAMRAAFNALTSDFVATGATSVVIVTNVNAGAVAIASDGAQPTGFAFANTTPGSSVFGTSLGLLCTNYTEKDSDLYILDPGSILLFTANVSATSAQVSARCSWYEI